MNNQPKFKRNTWANVGEAMNGRAAHEPRQSPAERREAARQFLSVKKTDPIDTVAAAAEFFAPDTKDGGYLPEADLKTLDDMIESRGLRAILRSLAQCLESRVEDGVLAGSTLLLHLSRDDKNARLALRLQSLACDEDLRE